MCACLNDIHALMRDCFLDRCALVCSYAENRRVDVCAYLGEIRALGAKRMG
jgi:hypothetical protein